MPGAAPPQTLGTFVARQDASYAWHVVGRQSVDGTEVAELRLQSQTWRGIPWKHRLFLLKPSRVATGSRALLVLSGGRWRPEYDVPQAEPSLPEEAELFLGIAESLETVLVVLDQVPYQPLFDLSEDDLVAYTFEQYQQSGEVEWPLLLPMVKSAARAMDAGQEVARQLWDIDIASFTVIGGSKRGWATWLAAAVDARVAAIAPIVIDSLNMEAHFPHQTEVWGAPSAKILPYTTRNLHVILSSDEGRELRELVDPYAYRAALRLPKLIVNASNDEYFPVDAVNLYWPGLRGPKYALYVPNDGHDLDDLPRLLATLDVFHRATAGLGSMPRVEWEYELEEGAVRLCVAVEPAAFEWRVWVAHSADRDFRDARWEEIAVAPDGSTLRFEQPRSSAAYLGLYAEAGFVQGGREFTLTTTPAVSSPRGQQPVVWSAVDQGRACR